MRCFVAFMKKRNFVFCLLLYASIVVIAFFFFVLIHKRNSNTKLLPEEKAMDKRIQKDIDVATNEAVHYESMRGLEIYAGAGSFVHYIFENEDADIEPQPGKMAPVAGEEELNISSDMIAGALDYSDDSMWVYRPTEHTNAVDVFFVCPTALQGDAGVYQINLDDLSQRDEFTGNVNIEKGLYDDKADFYAPFYRQMTLNGYYSDVSKTERDEYLAMAYTDIQAAFLEYINKYNDNRPFIFAGFSQGSDMLKRILMDYGDEDYMDRMVAAYLIGWNFTDEELSDNPQIKMATGESDLGVVISYCSEDAIVTKNRDSSVIVPTNTNGINPINWKVDDTIADKSDNMGSCFTGYDSSIIEEQINLCGCYLDANRGTLKVTDVSPEKFVPDLGFLDVGDYHVYDFLFFYRNIECNVQKRIATYLGEKFEYEPTKGPEIVDASLIEVTDSE